MIFIIIFITKQNQQTNKKAGLKPAYECVC